MSNLPTCICDHLMQAARLKIEDLFEAWIRLIGITNVSDRLGMLAGPAASLATGIWV